MGRNTFQAWLIKNFSIIEMEMENVYMTPMHLPPPSSAGVSYPCPKFLKAHDQPQ
jgi:hypothetical protein